MDDLYNEYLEERRAKKTDLSYDDWRKEKIDKLSEESREYWASVQRGKKKTLDVLNRKSCRGCLYATAHPGQTMTVWNCNATREKGVITMFVVENRKHPQCPIVRLWEQMKTAHLKHLAEGGLGNGPEDETVPS